jgi:membrane-associated phospholipid phosphatase
LREVIVAPWLYGILGLTAAVNLVWLASTRIDVYLGDALAIAAPIALFGNLLFITKRLLRYDETPARWLVLTDALFQGLFFLKLAWLNVRLLNHLTMSTALPYVDDVLIAWDRALGLDWLGYFQWVHDRPWAIDLLDVSYTSLSMLSVLALFALLAMGETLRARLFVEAFFVTAVISIAIGCLFPAEAAVVTMAGALDQYPNFETAPGVYHIAHMERLRAADAAILLDPMRLPGLVTIPSFHTAAGIILAAAFWRTKLAWPVLGYSIVMIASTPIFGGHYFVDLIAGTALAFLVFAALLSQPIYAPLRSGRFSWQRA